MLEISSSNSTITIILYFNKISILRIKDNILKLEHPQLALSYEYGTPQYGQATECSQSSLILTIWGGRPGLNCNQCRSRRSKPYSGFLKWDLSQVSVPVREAFPRSLVGRPMENFPSGSAPLAQTLVYVTALGLWLFKQSPIGRCFTAQEGDSKGTTFIPLREVKVSPCSLQGENSHLQRRTRPRPGRCSSNQFVDN